jgi:hypothetical protein
VQFGLNDDYGLVMAMDQRKVFLIVIRVDFIDTTGLRGYGTDYV